MEGAYDTDGEMSELLEPEEGESEKDFEKRNEAYVKAVEADKVRTEEAVRDAFAGDGVKSGIASGGERERVLPTEEEQIKAQEKLKEIKAMTPPVADDQRLNPDRRGVAQFLNASDEPVQEREKPPSKLGKVWNVIKMIATFWILGRFGNKRNNYNRRDDEYDKKERESGLEQLLSALSGNRENPPPFPA